MPPEPKPTPADKRDALILSILASIGIGIGAGFLVAAFNGLVTESFTSPHYQTAAQSHRFVTGITIGYGLLFAVASAVLIFIEWGKTARVLYPIAGLAALLTAMGFRNFGGAIGSLDCGYSCVDTVVPLVTQETATRSVLYTLIAIYIVWLIVYIIRTKKK